MKHFTIGRTALALLATGILFLSFAPVASARRGDSASTKLCKKGGYKNLYDAATGLPFTSQGACVSFGNHGGTYSSLKLTATVETFPIVGQVSLFSASGFGLKPSSKVTVFIPSGSVSGSVPADGTVEGVGIGAPCESGFSAYATGTTEGGAPITTPRVPPAC